jgi:hypothetical protein
MKLALTLLLTFVLCIGIASAESQSDNKLDYNSRDEKLVKQALKSEEAMYGYTHIRISPRVAQLGRIYEAQKQDKLAEQQFKRAMDIQEAHRKHNDSAPWDGAAELFRLYQRQGRIAEAKKIEAYRNSVLHINPAKPAANKNEKVSKEVGNAAALIYSYWQQVNNLTESDLKKLIELHKQIPDRKAQLIGTARAYCKLGERHIDQGKVKEGEQELQKALQLARQSQDSDAIWESLNSLAKLAASQKQLAKQRSYLEQVLALCVKTHGDSSPSTITQLAKLVDVAEKQKDYASAVAYSSRLIAAMERNEGRSDPRVIGLKQEHEQLKKKL